MQIQQSRALLGWATVLVVALSGTVALGQIPEVAEGGVLNAASFIKGQGVTPGSLVSIFGTELAAGLAQGDSVPLSTTLANVSVTFNGVPAPLQFVSPGQVNAQLPWNTLPPGELTGTATVVVMRDHANSLPKSVAVTTYAPGVFSIPPGIGYAIAINGDGSIAAPEGAITGYPTHPAHAGEVIIVYATGLGPVDPPVANGANSMDQLRNVVTKPAVFIGGVQAEVPFAGLTPQFPGVNQLNVVVPAVNPGDKIPIQIEVGGIRSTDQVVIAVAP